MSSIQRNCITNPVKGMMVFDTDSGYVFFYSNKWKGIKSNEEATSNYWAHFGTHTTLADNGDNVGIGTNTPDNAAVLDISATDKGLLIPRMNSIQRIEIRYPPNGLLAFDTDSGYLFFYKNGWKGIKSSAATNINYWSHSGKNITLMDSGNNVGIGTSKPGASAALDIYARDKGILVPRMSSKIRNSIANPENGLLVYDTTIKSFYFFNGKIWRDVGSTSSPSSNTAFLVKSGSMGFIRGTSAIIKFKKVEFDDASSFNTSTYTFEAPADGVYQLDASYYSTANGSSINNFSKIGICKNGNLIKENVDNIVYDPQTKTYYVNSQTSVIVKLTAGDKITVMASIYDPNSSKSILDYGQFSGYRIY